MRAECFHSAASLGEKCLPSSSSPLLPPPHLMLEDCAHPQEARPRPWFHKDAIHSANRPRGCLIKREYPLPRPRTTCTQGRDCEEHSAFIVARNVWTPTRQDSEQITVHCHTHRRTMWSGSFWRRAQTNSRLIDELTVHRKKCQTRCWFQLLGCDYLIYFIGKLTEYFWVSGQTNYFQSPLLYDGDLSPCCDTLGSD